MTDNDFQKENRLQNWFKSLLPFLYNIYGKVTDDSLCPDYRFLTFS